MAVGATAGLPEPTRVPPQPPVYQSRVSPAPAVAERTEDAPAQIEFGVANTPVGVVGTELTVTVTGAQLVLAHPVVVFLARAK